MSEIDKLKGEVSHWKALAAKFESSLSSKQKELDEFQSESRELEAELDLQLDQSTKENTYLNNRVKQLEMERDSFKSKLESLHFEQCEQNTRLEAQLNEMKNDNDRLQRYVRQLEQNNDDLERENRRIAVSLSDCEKKYNDAIEKIGLLQCELEEKLNFYLTTNQRLMEDNRDLQQELSVKCRTDRERPWMKITPSSPVSNGFVVPDTKFDMKRECSPKEDDKRTSNGFPASTRVSALQMVNDLLKMIGTVEAKLASCRESEKHTDRSMWNLGGLRRNRITSQNGLNYVDHHK